MNRSGTAFVFAAGGSLGAIEVGMLRALTAAGVTADFVVGSSVGAINAAHYAHDPTAEGVARLEQIWRRVRRRDVFPVSPVGGIVRLLAGCDYLLSPAALRRLMERNLTLQRLEEARLPCHIVAADLVEGKAVALSSGPAVQALLATTAIPGVFPPVCIRPRTLVDGAVASGTPVSTAVALGAARVIVLSPGLPCAAPRPPAGVVSVGLHALNLLIVNQLLADLERVKGETEIVIVPPLCPLPVSSYDFSRTGELIDRAAASTAEWLGQDGLHHHEIPDSLRPHRHDGPAGTITGR
ncbi:MAG: patatin-like phospholipase family protein [Gemmatimonadetes bacterium]|nr:patatin-like phospholipase family protein [Gemmatimonadota bacterium]